MRASFRRGACLLMMIIMLFSMRAAAFGTAPEEIGLVEEGEALLESAAVEEKAEDSFLLMEEEKPAPVIEIQGGEDPAESEGDLWLSDTARFQAGEDGTDEIPRVSGHGLVLSDRIGLAFCLRVPEAYRAGGFMLFEGGGDERRCEMPETPDDSGLYRFVCWLSPLQMAEEITPVFCQGEKRVRGEVYSVRAFIEEQAGDEKLHDLLWALGNYGHYAERRYRDAEPLMPRYGAEDYDYAAILNALADYRLRWRPVGLISGVRPVLTIDPAARLAVAVSMYNGFPRVPQASAYGIALEADEQSVFALAAVKLNGLGTMLNVTLTDAGQSADMQVCALSAVCDALDPAGTAAAEQKDFCAALYTLFTALRAYEDKL